VHIEREQIVKRNLLKPIAVVCAALALASTGLSQFSGIRSKVKVVGPTLPAKPRDCEMEVTTRESEKGYEKVADIDVYVKRNRITRGRDASYDEAIPELKKQGCKVGGDLVVVLRQVVSQSGEFKLLYIKAIAIRVKVSDGQGAAHAGHS